jgi:hypothetical protein
LEPKGVNQCGRFDPAYYRVLGAVYWISRDVRFQHLFGEPVSIFRRGLTCWYSTAVRGLDKHESHCAAGDTLCLNVGDRPLLSNIRTGLIDPDTPKSAHTMIAEDGKELKLVVSYTGMRRRVHVSLTCLYSSRTSLILQDVHFMMGMTPTTKPWIFGMV